MRSRSSFIQRLFVMLDITAVNITAVNLNLFVVFEALAAERNVTRAAKRLGVTQSAVSNALRQLRTLFDDPLFLRRSAGVEPTPRALALVDPVRRGLAALGDALAPPRFDPKTAERTFVIATSDYVELVLLPPLLARLAVEAPGVRLEIVPWGLHEVPDLLARGGADVMIGYYGKVPTAHREAHLFTEEFVCLVRKRHPTIRGKLTVKTWTSVPHVVVSQRPGSTSSIDRALAARGVSRTVGVRVSHFMIVPEIVARTDFAAALSRRIAEPAARAHDLRLFAPPIALGKSTVGMVWHDRLDADPGHRWLRSVITAVSARV
jgi:DNA-binding transcriptional LysR family regulator